MWDQVEENIPRYDPEHLIKIERDGVSARKHFSSDVFVAVAVAVDVF